MRKRLHTDSTGNEHYPEHPEEANDGPAMRQSEKTRTSQSDTGNNSGPGERQQQHLEAVLFFHRLRMEKSG